MNDNTRSVGAHGSPSSAGNQTEHLPDGVIVCLHPGAEPLTDEEKEALAEFVRWKRESDAINAQYQGAEREAKLTALREAYEAANTQASDSGPATS